ncbi:helix-turn-helix domain-containing protein [Actinomadura rubrisoli]|uniref:XRE family transcriptional regulator n=1 Tax=Actinomadura rubrisoli TaxID=2530368 RepID=A0A4R5ATP9_9ACTN|nr:helix-turn-helix transcriptional regulator [Actinomadura rubrisoli]TDD75066.1 XRE family transcriptional regulator [Actinomadura rubrisoli]
MTFNERLRELMAERGIGVRALARKVPCNPGHVSKLCHNIKRPSDQLAERLDTILDAGGELVALAQAADRTRSSERNTSGKSGVSVEASTQPHAWDDVLERRTLLQLAALGMGASALGPTGEPVRQLLALILDSEPREPDDWNMTLSDHLHALRTRPPAQVSTDLLVDLFAIQHQLQSADTTDKTELQRVTAALSILHANALTRLGDHGAAIHWSRTARAAADASDDLDLRMMVRCEEAGYGLYGQRDVATVLQLVDNAERLIDDTRSFWRADLAGTRAKAMSLLGRHDEARQALNIFVGYDGDDARASIIPALWTWSQASFAKSWVYAHVGNEIEADKAREEVLTRTRDYQYGANVRLHEALCTVVNGGTDRGAREASEILAALPPSQQSHMITETGKAVLRAVPRERQDRPAVRDLRAIITKT